LVHSSIGSLKFHPPTFAGNRHVELVIISLYDKTREQQSSFNTVCSTIPIRLGYRNWEPSFCTTPKRWIWKHSCGVR